jgi:glycosyltransferase involved in cell wall biosynthesis
MILIFFATNAKESSMRRAVPEKLAGNIPIIMVKEPISFVRKPLSLPLRKRLSRKRQSKNFLEIAPLHFPENIPLLSSFLKWRNVNKTAKEIWELTRNFAGPKIVFYDSPTQEKFVGAFHEDLSIYLAIDDRTVTVAGDPIHGELIAEKRLLEKVNHVICVSSNLAEVLRSRSSGRKDLAVDVLTNGYDERRFSTLSTYDEPNLITSISRPRVLVCGHVSDRIDWIGVIESIKLSDKVTWVFVGPTDDGIPEMVHGLAGRSKNRIRFFPKIDHSEIPAWVTHCEICAIPYKLNSFTRSSSPLKALEYLAMGARVMSTPIPALGEFGSVIEWVQEADAASYKSAIDKLLARGHDRNARVAISEFVKDHSWESKALKVIEIVEKRTLARH